MPTIEMVAFHIHLYADDFLSQRLVSRITGQVKRKGIISTSGGRLILNGNSPNSIWHGDKASLWFRNIYLLAGDALARVAIFLNFRLLGA